MAAGKCGITGGECGGALEATVAALLLRVPLWAIQKGACWSGE
jgi:hypothetical protein